MTARRIALGPASFLPRDGFVVVPLLPPFKMPDRTTARSALVGRSGGRLLAFANLCRHLAIPLDLGDGEVMDDSLPMLRCHHHNALFEPASGECVEGPCAGLSLWPFSVEIEGDEAFLLLAPGPSP